VTDPSYPGLVSKGFLASANVLWPALQQLLQREVLQGSVTSVTIAGHSLGAAMATMLSYRAQVGLLQLLHTQVQIHLIPHAVSERCWVETPSWMHRHVARVQFVQLEAPC
jgi:acetyl esterase/lipase